MNILAIGSDRGVFREGSAVQKRILKQSQYINELHVVVFSHFFKHRGLKKQKLGTNVWLYPTRSLSKFLYMYTAVKIAKNIIKKDPKNFIVTSQDPFEAGRVGVQLKRYFKIPLQIQIHTDFLSPHFAHIFLNRIRVRMAFKNLSYADRIRVVSKRIKEGLMESLKIRADKIAILPVFVDTESLLKANPQGINLRKKYPHFNFIILMASRLTREKNIDLALKVFYRVKKIFPKAGLVIVGKGPEEIKLQHTARNLGIKSSVMFEGWHDDISSYYKSAGMLLSTSLYEGFGMTLIEASLAGCPVVTSETGIVGDIFSEEHVAICPVHNENCFTEHVVSIILNNQKREIMKQNARARALEVFNLGIDAYTKRYMEEIIKTKN